MDWVVVGGIAGGIAAIYTAFRLPAIERLKADLTRRGLVYERQLDVISELYERIASVEHAAQRLLAPIRPAGQEPIEDSRQRFGEEFNELHHFFARRRLFLPKTTAVDVDQLIARIAETVVEFDGGRLDEKRGIKSERRGWDELWKEIRTAIPAVRETLEDDFRKILGMA